MKRIIWIALLVLFYLPASAQFGYGVQGAGTYNLTSVSVGPKDYNLNPAPCFGYGANAFYNIHQGMYRISLEAQYMAAAKAIYPKPDSVNTEILVRSFNISPGFQYALKGNFDSTGRVLYAFAGVDVNLYNYEVNGVNGGYEYDAYGYPILNPNTAMPVIASVEYTKSYLGVTPNLGVGWEWGLNARFHLFGQLKYSFGSKPTFNDIDQFNFTQQSMPKTFDPSYFSLNIGIRYWPDSCLFLTPEK